MTDKLTPNQSKLLAAFDEAMKGAGKSTQAAADKYWECVNAGIDMSKRCTPAMAYRFKLMATGKLLDRHPLEFMSLDDKTLDALSRLSKPEQQKAWKEGAPVLRAGRVAVVPLSNVRPSEAAQIVDATRGVGRLRTPKEMMMRAKAKKKIQMKDHSTLIHWTYEEFRLIKRRADSQGKTIPAYIKSTVMADVEHLRRKTTGVENRLSS